MKTAKTLELQAGTWAQTECHGRPILKIVTHLKIVTFKARTVTGVPF